MELIALKYIDTDIDTYIVNTVNYFWFNNDQSILNRLYEDDERTDFSYNELLAGFLSIYMQYHSEIGTIDELVEKYSKRFDEEDIECSPSQDIEYSAEMEV